MKPIVAIVGRPNVGKSTLFNRLTRSRSAIVDNFPGVTRDRIYGDASWDGVDFTVADTGGFAQNKADAFARKVEFQLFQAIEEADIIVFMFDGKSGMSPFDRDLAETLRSIEKPIFYLVNKIDTAGHEIAMYDFYQLGIETFYPVSAAHGYGVGEFLDSLIQHFPESAPELSSEMTKVAVVGRPNVGKSSFINRILNEDRLLVSEIPGTTRDAIDTACTIDGTSYLFIDTAGIRRKGRVRKKIEKFSVLRALRSLERCDVAIILLDASEGITEQDLTVAGYAVDRGCGCILALNKWDLITSDPAKAKHCLEQVRFSAKFLSFAPVLTVSAQTGLRVVKIFGLIDTVYQQYCTRLGTGPLNKILENALFRTPPSLHKGRRIKIYYATQAGVKPPTFICFANYPEAVHFSYQRYLINQIREKGGFDRVPIRLLFRKRPRRDLSGKSRVSGRRD